MDEYIKYSLLPDTILLDIRDEADLFKDIVCNVEFPTVDFISTIQKIFDTLINLTNSDEVLGKLGFEMGHRDMLFEHAELTMKDKIQIASAVFVFGNKIKNKLVVLNAYRDEILPYRFGGMINDDTIVIRKTDSTHWDYFRYW